MREVLSLREKQKLTFMEKIKETIEVAREKDPAAKGAINILVNTPGIHAIMFHRVAHSLYNRKHFFIARLISQISRFLTGIEIHPGAQIGEGFFAQREQCCLDRGIPRSKLFEHRADIFCSHDSLSFHLLRSIHVVRSW